MINNALFLAMIDSEVDKLAFEQLVHNYERRLFRIAVAILRNRTAAEDAVCETFLRVAKCFQKVNTLNVHELDAYMIISIRSVCFQMYNKEKNNRFDLSLDEMVIEPFEEANHYDYALLKAEIAALEDKYKNVLVYTYFYGMNAEETADAMGVSRRTVYNYINEARAILKEKLGEELNV